MEENYYASVCYYGVQGGAIRLTDEYFLFRCQKASVEDEFKRIEIPYTNMKRILYKTKLFIFPRIVTIEQYKGKTYKFLVFNAERFINTMKNKGINISHIK
jgi:uncharacterized protein YicC (UPF0701 family)